mgnify:CR=1 FL=1
MNKRDRDAFIIFERQILRRIYGIVCENGVWRLRHIADIDRIIRGKDIIKSVKSLRLGWVGHVERMEDSRIPKTRHIT